MAGPFEALSDVVAANILLDAIKTSRRALPFSLWILLGSRSWRADGELPCRFTKPSGRSRDLAPSCIA
jgi:hypothetical protein